MAYYYNQTFLDECSGKGLESSKSAFRDGKTVVSFGEDKIHASLRMILSTRVGERFFIPEFGSKLHLAIFEQNDLVSRDLMKFYAKDAIDKWEKRIVVDDIEVGRESDDNVIPVTVLYHIANSNISGSFVYPFSVTDRGEPSLYEFGSMD